SRVKPAIRERLVQYQRECFQALYDYWSKGVAKRHDGLTDEQRQILNEVIRHSAIRAADPVRHNACVAIDKKLRERFGSPIPAERFEEAVEYVNSLDHRDIYHLPEALAR